MSIASPKIEVKIKFALATNKKRLKRDKILINFLPMMQILLFKNMKLEK